MDPLPQIETLLQKLDSKTKEYTEKEKSTIGYQQIKSALTILPKHISDHKDLHETSATIESLIDSIPPKKNGSTIDVSTYSSALSSFKQELKKKYQIVPKGTYLNLGVLGMPIGFLLGLLLDTIVFGLLIGLTIGLIIGSQLEKKAEQEHRLLH